MSKQTRLIKMNQARHMVITPVARISFPNVFQPRSFQDNPELKKEFSADLIFDSKAELKKAYAGKKMQTVSIAEAVVNCKRDQWGPDKAKWPKFNYSVFKEGNERVNKEGEVYQGYADKVFLTARSGEKFPPKIVDRFGKPITDEKELYGGCYVRAQLMARPYDFGGNRGVRFLLLQLMKWEDGEKFGGFSQDVFDVEEMSEDSFDGDDAAGDDDDDF